MNVLDLSWGVKDAMHDAVAPHVANYIGFAEFHLYAYRGNIAA